jgi:hypothetical protein
MSRKQLQGEGQSFPGDDVAADVDGPDHCVQNGADTVAHHVIELVAVLEVSGGDALHQFA